MALELVYRAGFYCFLQHFSSPIDVRVSGRFGNRTKIKCKKLDRSQTRLSKQRGKSDDLDAKFSNIARIQHKELHPHAGQQKHNFIGAKWGPIY